MLHHIRISAFAMMLAAAGIPLYIHLPRYAAVELGLSLQTLGLVLMVIRLVDLFQDPYFGWLIDRRASAQRFFAPSAALGLALGFPLLFAAPIAGAFQLGLVLTLLFSAYSLGTILLYARTDMLAVHGSSLLKVATYREAGALIGVIGAAILPTVLGAADGGGYQSFGFLIGALALCVAVFSAPLWRLPPTRGAGLSLRALLASGALRLLLIALVNALPVAITSTLFLFFTEDRLKLTGWSGPLLLLFFAAALVSLLGWRMVSRRLGARATLLIAMPLSVASFVGAFFLSEGALVGFAVISALSGAALGADMLLLPILFSASLKRAGLDAAQGFGLWSFAGKLSLACAAFTVLPVLDLFEFTPGGSNSAQALVALSVAYALVPCALKIAAFYLVTRLKEEAI